MQPTLIFTASAPGMIFINGRFAGEASAERPLYLPTAPYGAVYIEYHPLIADRVFSAWKCVFSGGKLMPDSLENAEGLIAISWPESIFEIELAPVRRTMETFHLNNIPCILCRESRTTLSMGNLSLNLPDNALPPKLEYIHDIPILFGEISGGGQYLMTLARDYSIQTGFLIADQIDFDGQNGFNAIIALEDFAGHAKRERWQISGGILQRASSEFIWKDGMPHQPESAEETIIAAIETALIGLMDEAYANFTPALKAASPLNAIRDSCEFCVSMKYGAHTSRPCIGLARTINSSFAVVSPLYYHAFQIDNAPQKWMIDWLSTV